MRDWMMVLIWLINVCYYVIVYRYQIHIDVSRRQENKGTRTIFNKSSQSFQQMLWIFDMFKNSTASIWSHHKNVNNSEMYYFFLNVCINILAFLCSIESTIMTIKNTNFNLNGFRCRFTRFLIQTIWCRKKMLWKKNHYMFTIKK